MKIRKTQFGTHGRHIQKTRRVAVRYIGQLVEIAVRKSGQQVPRE